MKKLFTLLLVTTLLISCSSDDNFYGNQSDLTGTWNVESVKFEGYNLPLSECDSKESIVISSDGNAVWTTAIEDEESGECALSTSNMMFTGLQDNVNFNIDYDVDFSIFYNGKFLSRDKIQVTKRFEGSKTIYVFVKN